MATRKTVLYKTVLLLGFLAVFFGVPSGVFKALRTVDGHSCEQVFPDSGRFVVKSPFEDGLVSLILPDVQDGVVSFGLENRTDETLSLCICQLYFPHRIFGNGMLVSQNESPDSPHFDPAMRRKTFQVSPNSPERTFRIEGAGAGSIHVYAGRNASVALQQRIAAELNCFLAVVVLAIGLLTIIVSIVYKRVSKLDLAVLAAFVFFLLRISILDNFAFGSTVFAISAEWFRFWDSMTTFGFSPSMFLIYALLFDVQPRRVFYPALVGYTLFILIDFSVTAFSGGTVVLLPLVLLYRVLLFAWILSFALLSGKPFSKSVNLVHAVSDGFMVYYGFLKTHPNDAGLLAFYVDPGFLGLSIQFLFALVLLISRTLVQARDYNRLLMLRGLEHDLKIPLSVIKLNHQMIRRYSLRDDDENGLRFSGAIDRALADLDGMFQNLRYHLEDQPAVRGNRTELSELFQTLGENFRAVCSLRNAVLDVEVSEPSPVVAVDPDILKRILHNLLDNAFKHTTASPRVSLSAKERFGKVVITVCDNGEGMTESECRKSVRLFHKADPARGTPGLGLGLHVVRNLIRQNRGSMDIKSRTGEGTSIIITLPRVS